MKQKIKLNANYEETVLETLQQVRDVLEGFHNSEDIADEVEKEVKENLLGLHYEE